MPAIDPGDALLAVDVQNDFCPGGALAVPDGDAVVPAINRLARRFARVVMTQDWHPPGHASFASSHPGRKPFETIAMPYGPQTLWPDHCVQGTSGAAFHPGLDLPSCTLVIRKGHHPAVDSYSTFVENDRTTPTGLTGYLRELGVRHVWLAGLATDYCVKFSALDALARGFAAVVVVDACRALSRGAEYEAALAEMRAAGAILLQENEVG